MTFCGAPASDQADGSATAVLGIPFDAGTHPTRVGARLGPAAIREQSSLVMPFDPTTGISFIEASNLLDLGDVPVVPGDVEASFPAATAAVEAITNTGSTPVVMGGDGLITLPVLRALAKKHADLAVVHIDAHTDSYPGPGFTTAHTFTRAAEEGLIDPRQSIHLGLRGTTYHPEAWSHARDLGFTLVTTDEWKARSNADVVAQVFDLIGKDPAHLSFDMDVFDPSVAPGVCTPAWGGVDAATGLDLIDQLTVRQWVGFDIQTVSPPHDVGGLTALLAATVMAQFVRSVVDK